MCAQLVRYSISSLRSNRRHVTRIRDLPRVIGHTKKAKKKGFIWDHSKILQLIYNDKVIYKMINLTKFGPNKIRSFLHKSLLTKNETFKWKHDFMLGVLPRK